MRNQHTDPRVGLLVVGFSPPQRLAAITRHLGWPGSVLADPERELYRRLDIGRAPWWRVWTPATIAIYLRAWRAGQRFAASGEDTRQLGGDAVLVDGTVLRLWRPRSPDDRPDPADLLAAASSAGSG